MRAIDPRTAVVRPARITDAAAIADIFLTSRKAHLPYAPSKRDDETIRRWVAEELVPGGGVKVADGGGEVLGFIAVRDAGDARWIDHLYVRPDHTGRGVGSWLIGEAILRLAAPVRAWCFQQNDGARRFYAQWEFAEVKLTDGSENEEGVPDVLLERGG